MISDDGVGLPQAYNKIKTHRTKTSEQTLRTGSLGFNTSVSYFDLQFIHWSFYCVFIYLVSFKLSLSTKVKSNFDLIFWSLHFVPSTLIVRLPPIGQLLETLASDWSMQITWPEYWPLIGPGQFPPIGQLETKRLWPKTS